MVSRQSSAAPKAPQAMPSLAEFRHAKGPLRPVTPGSRRDFGTRTLSIMIIPVGEARRENLPSIFGVVIPGIERSRRKPLTLSESDESLAGRGGFVMFQNDDSLPSNLILL